MSNLLFFFSGKFAVSVYSSHDTVEQCEYVSNNQNHRPSSCANYVEDALQSNHEVGLVAEYQFLHGVPVYLTSKAQLLDTLFVVNFTNF